MRARARRATEHIHVRYITDVRLIQSDHWDSRHPTGAETIRTDLELGAPRYTV
jgi:hypothetical protein